MHCALFSTITVRISGHPSLFIDIGCCRLDKFCVNGYRPFGHSLSPPPIFISNLHLLVFVYSYWRRSPVRCWLFMSVHVFVSALADAMMADNSLSTSWTPQL